MTDLAKVAIAKVAINVLLAIIITALLAMVGAVLCGCSPQPGAIMDFGERANRPHVVAGLGSDYETSTISLAYAPDASGSIGARLTTDSLIEDGTRDNVAIGPAIDFNLTEYANKLADVVIPGPWQPLANAPFNIYGTLYLAWETQNKNLLFAPGLETRFLPTKRIQPTVLAEYLMPEERSTIQDGMRVTLGAKINF
jgi:hypothetical protein